MIARLLLLILFASGNLWCVEPQRTWTNLDGVKMEATLIRFKKDKIEIKRGDGRTFTLVPTMFSEEDQKYITEARIRTDSSGEFWSKERAIYHLSKSKWIDGSKDRPIFHYLEFRREKIDLNKDGKNDGYKLWRWTNRGVFTKGRAYAWEVNESGILIVKDSGLTRETRFNYDFSSGNFVRISGYVISNFLAPDK
jgi:hypothetical protein